MISFCRTILILIQEVKLFPSLFLGVLILCNSAIAETRDVFTGYGIEVYAESDNLDNAKQEGYNQAISNGYKQVIERLLPKASIWKANTLDKNSAFDNVKIATPVKERMTAYTYLATFDVSFKADKIKNALNRLGVRYADKFDVAKIIIPILYEDGTADFWSDSDWRSAWLETPEIYGLSQFEVPLGDALDIEEIDTDLKSNQSFGKLKPILKRYESDGAVLIKAVKSQDKINVEVRILTDTEDTLKSISYKRKDENDVAFYKRIQADLLANLDDLYKGVDNFDAKKLFRTRLMFEAKDSKEWLIIRERIYNIPEVQDIKMNRSSQNNFDFSVMYQIPPKQMMELLNQNKFKVTEKNGTQYIENLSK